MTIKGGYAAKLEISHIRFHAPVAIDFFSDQTETGDTHQYSQIVSIKDCTFDWGNASDSGTAISLKNHDFSVIERCNLTNYSGKCGIKVRGLPGKNTTQVKISDCSIRGPSIGISIDMVDNTKITGNDFGSSLLTGIDLGGKIFDSSGWQGNFTNTDIRDNHFENCFPAITANGSPNTGRVLNHSTRIQSNGMFMDKPSQNMPPFIFLDNCTSVNTYNNSMYLNTDAGSPGEAQLTHFNGFQLSNSLNCSFLFDNFFHTFDAQYIPASNLLIDGGGNLGTFFWDSYHGTSVSTQSQSNSYFISGTTHGILQQEKPNHGAMGAFSGITLNVSKEISANGNLNLNGTLNLIPLSNNSAGILVLAVNNSIGSFYTTYAIGSNGGNTSITKLSGEGNTTLVYSLSVSGGYLVYEQVYNASSVPTFVKGMFSGLQ